MIKNSLLNLAIFLPVLLGASILGVIRPSNNSDFDRDGGFQTSSKSVLGVNSKNSETLSCSSEKPIIGWIDYKGQKLIVPELAQTQTPSACFKTLEDANYESYFEK